MRLLPWDDRKARLSCTTKLNMNSGGQENNRQVICLLEHPWPSLGRAHKQASLEGTKVDFNTSLAKEIRGEKSVRFFAQHFREHNGFLLAHAESFANLRCRDAR